MILLPIVVEAARGQWTDAERLGSLACALPAFTSLAYFWQPPAWAKRKAAKPEVAKAEAAKAETALFGENVATGRYRTLDFPCQVRMVFGQLGEQFFLLFVGCERADQLALGSIAAELLQVFMDVFHGALLFQTSEQYQHLSKQEVACDHDGLLCKIAIAA